jgi:MFS family permease
VSEPSTRYARIILLIALVGMGFGFTVLFAILAPLGREVGFSELQISSIIAASSLAVFLTSPRWGRLSDRWGRKKVLLIGVFGYTLGTLLFAYAFHLTLTAVLIPTVGYYALLITRIMHASIMSAMMPSASAYMADITDISTRTKGMGAVGAAINLGNIIGPAVGGLLATFSLLTPLWFGAGLAFVTALFILFMLPESPVPTTQLASQEKQKPKRQLSYFDRRIFPLVVVGVTMFMGMALVQQTLPFRFQDALNLTGVETAQTFGLAMGLSALASLSAQLFIMQRFDLRPFQWMRVTLPILIVAFTIMALSESQSGFMIAMCLQGAAMGLAGPAFMAGASMAVTAEEQGSVAGVAGSCGPLGFTIGPLVGGFFYQIDPTLPYWFTVAIYIPLLGFVIHHARKVD